MFRVNQKVVCVDDSDFIIKKIKIGDIVTIKSFYYGPSSGRLMLVFKEHDSDEFFGHLSTAFRPITYISDSQFEELEKELNKEEYAKI